MSEYNLDLRERETRIQVKEIIEKIKEDSTGLPGMRIKDQNGQEHHLTAVSFTSFEWEDIKEGSILVIELKEEIEYVRLLRE